MLSCAQHHAQIIHDARNAADNNGCAAATTVRVPADLARVTVATTMNPTLETWGVGEAGVCGGGPGQAVRRPLYAHDTTLTMDIMGGRQDGEWAALPLGGGAPLRAVAGRGSLKNAACIRLQSNRYHRHRLTRRPLPLRGGQDCCLGHAAAVAAL
jgi:hypothetical protein